MGILFGSPSPASTPAPSPVPVVPPAANPPILANSQVSQAGAAARSRAAAAAGAGLDNTVTNTGGPKGLTEAGTPTAKATLLG